MESQVRISGGSIEEGEHEYHEYLYEDEHCEDEIEHLLDGMCDNQIVDEMQARVEDFGQILTSIIQKESFGYSMKSVELLARIEQLTIVSEITLTQLYEQIFQIEIHKINRVR